MPPGRLRVEAGLTVFPQCGQSWLPRIGGRLPAEAGGGVRAVKFREKFSFGRQPEALGRHL